MTLYINTETLEYPINFETIKRLTNCNSEKEISAPYAQVIDEVSGNPDVQLNPPALIDGVWRRTVKSN